MLNLFLLTWIRIQMTPESGSETLVTKTAQIQTRTRKLYCRYRPQEWSKYLETED